MKRNYSALAILISLSMLSSLSFAKLSSDNMDNQDVYTSDNELARVEVSWVKPKKFTDVREDNFSSAKYRKYVFKDLEKHLDELAEDLPQGQTMRFTVSDLDLAGRIEPANFVGLSNSFDDIRVMRNVDIPRIKFHYEIVDADGLALKSEDVNLKDMSYLTGISTLGRNRAFYYEKKMLTKWFKRNVLVP